MKAMNRHFTEGKIYLANKREDILNHGSIQRNASKYHNEYYFISTWLATI